MQTAVMTDTNSGITVEEGRALGIFVLPMPVIIDKKDHLEGVDVTHTQLFEAIEAGIEVSSSQPSPGSLTDLWERILEGGFDEVIYIPMSSGLSGACSAASAVAEEYEGRVQVADNHRISVTLHDSVLDAQKMAQAGASALEIKSYLEEHAYESSIYIAVNSLDLLRKSGRVTPAAAAIATVMNLKPILTIQGGKLDSFAKARGVKHCMKKILEAAGEDIRTRFSQFPAERISIGAAGSFSHMEDELAWLAAVQEAFPDHPTFYGRLSCSIACHVSVDAIGLGISVLHE